MTMTEIIKGNLVRTYSDTAMMIERDGVMYNDAIDPIDSGRVYVETEVLIAEPDAEI